MNPNPTVASRRGLVHFLGLHPKQDLAHGPAQRPRGRVPWLLLIVGLGLGLLAWMVRRRAGGDLRPLLAALALASPVLVFLSFPACFLLGGAALALLPAVGRSRLAGQRWLFAAFGAVLGVSFLVLYCTAI